MLNATTNDVTTVITNHTSSTSRNEWKPCPLVSPSFPTAGAHAPSPPLAHTARLGGDLKWEADAEEKRNSLRVQKLKLEHKRRCVTSGEGHRNPKFSRGPP